MLYYGLWSKHVVWVMVSQGDRFSISVFLLVGVSKMAFTGSLHRLFTIAFAHWASHCVCLWFEYDLCSLGAAVFGKYCPGNLRATAKSCRWEDSATQKDSRSTQHWLQCYFSILISPWIINEPSMNHQNVVVKPNFKSHPQFITIFGWGSKFPLPKGCAWGLRRAQFQ